MLYKFQFDTLNLAKWSYIIFKRTFSYTETFKDGFSLFHLWGGGGGGGGGGVWTNHGGCNFFPDNGLLARRNFAHTIQDLL